MEESTHEHATDNLTLFSPFASKIHIKPKFNLSGILPWVNNNLMLLGPKRRLGYLAQEYWVSQTLQMEDKSIERIREIQSLR